MSSHVDKQILRLFMLIHKVCLPVVRKFFEKFILCKQEYDNKFEKFLERHKHDLYHMFCEVRCCECNTKTHKNECGQIFREHFVLMYDMGMPNHSHIKKKKDTDIAVQNCICGIKVKLACSKKNLDLSTLNAILRLFQTHLNNNHIMWLKMISKERNTLCHLSEFNQLTESDVNTMWGYLEMAVMGLATDIPVEDYEDDIKTQIELLKEIDYSQDKVQPIIDEMKRGVRTIETLQNQQNEWMKEEFNRLQSTREDDKKELIEHLSQFKDEIVSHQDRNTKAQQAKLDSALQQLGKLFHKTKDQLYHVEYSFDSSFRLVADAQSKGAELVSVEFETGPESQRDVAGHNDVCIYWKMKPRCCTKEEMDYIKASMRKAAQSLDCWFPYKITHIFDGSIVIGTIVSGDVLKNKHKFEESIRQFLDVFSRVFELHKQVTIDVEIVISKSPSTAISNYCCYETCKVVTKEEKAMLATPDMLDEMVDASIDTDNKAIQTDAIKNATQVRAYFYKLEIQQIMWFVGKDLRRYAIYVGCTPNIESWFHRFISCLTKSLMENPTVMSDSSYCSFEKPIDDSIFLLPISGTTCNLLQILDDTMLKYTNTLNLRFGNTEIPQQLQHFRSFDVSESILIPDELLREIRLWSQTYFIKLEIEPEKWIVSKIMSLAYSRHAIFIGCITEVEKWMNQLADCLLSYFSVIGPSYHMNVPPEALFGEQENMIIIPVTGSENDKYLMERLAVTTLKSSNVLILEFDDTEIPIDFRQFKSIKLSKEHFESLQLVTEVRYWLETMNFRNRRIPAESKKLAQLKTGSEDELSTSGKRVETMKFRHKGMRPEIEELTDSENEQSIGGKRVETMKFRHKRMRPEIEELTDSENEQSIGGKREIMKFRLKRMRPEIEESAQLKTGSEDKLSTSGKRALTSDAEKSDKQAITQTESSVKLG